MKINKESCQEMNYNHLIKYGREHNIDEKLCSYLLKHYLFINNKNKLINKEEIKKYKRAIKKLKKNQIQYVIGNVNLYGYKNIINKQTLIHKFEKEKLEKNTLNT